MGMRAPVPTLVLALACLAPVGAPCAQPEPVPVAEHARLSLPLPMAVVGTRFIQTPPAAQYFAGLATLGFACDATDMPRWNLRRIRVECGGRGGTLLYEGGFASGWGMVTFDRIWRDGVLLGGRDLARHVDGVIAAARGGSQAVADVAAPAPR